MLIIYIIHDIFYSDISIVLFLIYTILYGNYLHVNLLTQIANIIKSTV